MCDNPACNKVRTVTHTSDECWGKHPDLIPENLKKKIDKRKKILKVIGKDSFFGKNQLNLA